MTEQQQQIGKAMDQHPVLLLVAPSDLCDSSAVDAVKHFRDSGGENVVFITAGKTYKKAVKHLSEEGIDTDSIFFIDATSHKGTVKKGNNAIFVRPQDLYNISISLTTALKHFPEDEPVLVVLNSLTTLAVFNTQSTVTKFSRHIISKIEDLDKQAVLLTLSGKDQESFIAKLRQFADGQHVVE